MTLDARWVLIVTVQLLACKRFDVPSDDSGVLELCGAGTGSCVPAALVEFEQTDQLVRDICREAQLCVPAPLLRSGQMRFEPCVASATSAEGRCVPEYLPRVAERSGLARDGCPKFHACVPCFDPWDGSSTEACELPDDPGPVDPPTILSSCCNDLGRCVPARTVSAKDRERLVSDSCDARKRLVCAPALLVEDPEAVPSECTVRSTGAEGRCLPRCFLGDTQRTQALQQDECPDMHVCAPCFDPVDGSSTDACDLGSDEGPKQPPALFPECCGGLARCVPSSLVTEADRDELDAADCTDENALCAPASLLADPPQPPARCRASVLGAEGRCLPACLPRIAAQREVLAQDECRSGELCAPCFDPLDGSDSGACRLAGDPGPTDPPARFPGCCDGVGLCVPAPLVPDEWSDELDGADCEASDARCVPAEFARDPASVAPTCRDESLGLEGRCLPSCLPRVAAMLERLTQADCAPVERCVPCFDPTDGTDTGACHLGGDPGPTASPRTLDECCEGAGRCAPTNLVPPELLERTDAADCSEANTVCVPRAALESDAFVPRTCRDPTLDAEGRCLPACLPEVAARASMLRRADCETGELCVLCFDPLDASNTGACHLGADPGPVTEPSGLPDCCDGAGLCAPTELVPDMLRAQTARLDCEGPTEALCVPAGFVRDPDYVAAACRDPVLNAEGRCLPSCLPSVAEQASRLRRAGCRARELCVPCYDPVTGEATGACSATPADPGPTAAPVVFEPCCGTGDDARGLCVPVELLPEGFSEPPTDTCRNSRVCAPAELVSDARGRLSTCSSTRTIRGVCVGECFISGLQGVLVARGTCAADSQCVPCEISGSETGVCAP